jgi:hypothetical protein
MPRNQPTHPDAPRKVPQSQRPEIRLVIDTFTVIPTEVGIHAFADSGNKGRGWCVVANHDAVPPTTGRSQLPPALPKRLLSK